MVSNGSKQTLKNHILRQVVVREQEPEAKDRLGQDIEDGVSDDLAINGNVTGSIGNAPDTGRN